MRFVHPIGVVIACVVLPSLVRCGAAEPDGFTNSFTDNVEVLGSAQPELEQVSGAIAREDNADVSQVIENLTRPPSNASERDATPLRGVKTLVAGVLLFVLALLVGVFSSEPNLHQATVALFRGTFVEKVAKAVVPDLPRISFGMVCLAMVTTLVASGLFELGMSMYNRWAARQKGKPASKYPLRGLVILFIAALFISISLQRIYSGKQTRTGGSFDVHMSVGLGVGAVALVLFLHSLTQRILHKPPQDNSKNGTDSLYREGEYADSGAASEQHAEAEDAMPFDVNAEDTGDVSVQHLDMSGIEDQERNISLTSSTNDSIPFPHEDIDVNLESKT